MSQNKFLKTQIIEQRFKQISQPFVGFFKNFNIVVSPILKYFEELKLSKQQCDLLVLSGWVPHYTTPFHEINTCDGCLSYLLEKHYKDNWMSLRNTIANRVKTYKVDDEAKKTFLDSLEMHDAGYYKSVPRNLYPEIERLVRNKFRDKNTFFKGISSIHDLRKSSENIALSDIGRDELFVITLLEMLDNNFYRRCKNFEILENLKESPIPNRHAAIHGYVTYDSYQNSLNSIFIADFIFYLLQKIELE